MRCYAKKSFGLQIACNCLGYIAILFFCLLPLGCSDKNDNLVELKQETSVKYCKFSKEFMSLLKLELEKQSIEYIEDNDCLIATNEFSESFLELADKLAGVRPPAGRSMSWSTGIDKYKKLLESNGIKTKIHVFAGEEYLVWEKEHALIVEEILEIKPWRREIMADLREQNE